jgi:hypothetical protein
VTEGRLTEEHATAMKEDLKQRVTDLVNGTRPEGFGRAFGPEHGFGGGPAMAPAGFGGPTF